MVDFEAEGLLDGLQGKAREARLALLEELAESGIPLEELKKAVEENRLVLLPVERVFGAGEERYTAAEIAEGAGIERDFLVRLLQALGAPIPSDDERAYTDRDMEAARRGEVVVGAGLAPAGGVEGSPA